MTTEKTNDEWKLYEFVVQKAALGNDVLPDFLVMPSVNFTLREPRFNCRRFAILKSPDRFIKRLAKLGLPAQVRCYGEVSFKKARNIRAFPQFLMRHYEDEFLFPYLQFWVNTVRSKCPSLTLQKLEPNCNSLLFITKEISFYYGRYINYIFESQWPDEGVDAKWVMRIILSINEEIKSMFLNYLSAGMRGLPYTPIQETDAYFSGVRDSKTSFFKSSYQLVPMATLSTPLGPQTIPVKAMEEVREMIRGLKIFAYVLLSKTSFNNYLELAHNISWVYHMLFTLGDVKQVFWNEFKERVALLSTKDVVAVFLRQLRNVITHNKALCASFCAKVVEHIDGRLATL